MEKPVRILHVIQRLESAGAQTILMNIYKNIDRSKVQFDFLVEYKEKYFYDEEVEKMGGKIYYSSVRQDFNVLKFEKYLKKIIKENNYQIIHVHADTIGYFCLKTAKKCGVKTRIAHAHNSGINKDFKYFFRRIMLKLYHIYATDLFACSNDAGLYFFGNNKGFTVINNAIDSKKFKADDKIRNEIRDELNIKNNFVVGHVGRFHYQKNHDFLIDIFVKIKNIRKDAKLLLVGSGPLEEKIKEKIVENEITNDVIILNNRKDMNRIYQAMDVFVFPSLFEGLPLVGVEVQASGIPSLLSDTITKDLELTPLCLYKSLKDSAEEWAFTAVELSNNKYSHTDMCCFIENANYDINDISKKMEVYYLNKIKNNCEEDKGE